MAPQPLAPHTQRQHEESVKQRAPSDFVCAHAYQHAGSQSCDRLGAWLARRDQSASEEEADNLVSMGILAGGVFSGAC